jgi:predicted enzyme related to lactoylglutathione lyase
MFKRIDHVEIVTDQLDRTVQFYTQVLVSYELTRDNKCEESDGRSGGGMQ